MGHICFYATEGDQKAVFTGDTLFVGGAGKFFEGTPEQMQQSLGEKLGKLPAETLVYCGHEVSRFRITCFPTTEHKPLPLAPQHAGSSAVVFDCEPERNFDGG